MLSCENRSSSEVKERLSIDNFLRRGLLEDKTIMAHFKFWETPIC